MLDFNYAVRQLFKSPDFTCVAAVTLGLCIGANLTIFAVLDAILLRSLPFPQPERLVALNNAYPGAGIERGGASIANYFDRRNSITGFDAIGMYREILYTVGEAESCRRVETARVTPGFFELLGVPLAMGREFTNDELDFSKGDVVILTDRFWRGYFNADPNILGRTFTMMGRPTTVLGVLPPGFRYLSSKAEIFRPLTHYRDRRSSTNLHAQDGQMIARLAPDSTIHDAQAQLNAFNARQMRTDPASQSIAAAGYHTEIKPLHDDHVRTVKPLLVLMQGSVLCLLLIGAVNLTGLLLIRASGRTKEMAIRKALGAGPWPLAMMTLMETVLLALAGGAIGIALGALGVRLTKHLGTDLLPLGAEIVFDSRIAFVSLAVSLVVGVSIAIPIIWSNSRDNTNTHLQSESRGGTSSRGVQNLRHVFIVAQMALAFVLLCGAGLLSTSLKRALDQSPGFDPDQVLAGEIMLTDPNRRDREAFVKQLETQLGAIPGVSQVAVSSRLPFTLDGTMAKPIFPEANADSTSSGLRTHTFASVTSGYWDAMGIPLLQGRLLTGSDGANSARVAVIGKSLADFYWPNGDPVGQRFSAEALSFYDRTLFGDTETDFDETTAYTVVGVVGDVKQDNLTESESTGTVYLPYTGWEQLQVVLRTPAAAETMRVTVEQLIRRLDPQMPLNDFRSMRSRIDDSLVMRRSPAILATVFAAVALLLAAIGIYGTLAYVVAQRRREIGIRMALGARRLQIGSQFLYMGMKLFAAGALLGIIGAWSSGRIMQSILFQVPPLHTVSLVGTALAIALVTLIASLIPAIRASRTNPMEALRND